MRPDGRGHDWPSTLKSPVPALSSRWLTTRRMGEDAINAVIKQKIGRVRSLPSDLVVAM
jgi:hypothetical protein